MRACIFDLDHTLIHSSLDLAAMALAIRAMVEDARGPLPPRPDRYRVGELITLCQTSAPELEARAWAIALDHEQQALDDALVEPGALEAIAAARQLGYATMVWTNNARVCTDHVLTKFGLAPHFDLIVTRDEMKALKPDPDGFRVIRERWPEVRHAVVVGDSWVDGLAAAAVGLPFIAYRPKAGELEARGVTPIATLARFADLRAVLEADGGPTRTASLPASPMTG